MSIVSSVSDAYKALLVTRTTTAAAFSSNEPHFAEVLDTPQAKTTSKRSTEQWVEMEPLLDRVPDSLPRETDDVEDNGEADTLAAFMFRGQADDATTSRRIWGRVFSTASTITPFLFGAAAAAVASGQVRVEAGRVQTDLLAGWTTPFALTIGALALSLCAVLAAVNPIVEAQNSNEPELVEAFRRRAMIAGAITLALDVVAFILSPFQAPLLWHGALDHALPLIIATALIGLGAAASLLLRRYRLARMLSFTVTAFIFASWGLSQFPYLVPVAVTISNATSPSSTLLALLIGTIIGMALLLPSLWVPFPCLQGQASYAERSGASGRASIHAILNFLCAVCLLVACTTGTQF